MRDTDPSTERWWEAAALGDTARVIKFLNSGFDINTREWLGATALFKAVDNGHLETIRVLLERGAGLDFEDSFRWTALTHAVCQTLRRPWDPSYEPDSEPLKLLEAAGARYNLIDAVLTNDVELARSRLEEGSDPNHGEGTYHGPVLKVAAEAGHVEMIDLLLDHGANIEALDDITQSPLHGASLFGQTEAAIRLLDRGADIDAESCPGVTALAIAAIDGHHDLVELLMSRGAKRGIVDALALNDQTILIVLLDEELRDGADIEWITDGRYRIAMLAARLGNPMIVRLLLDRGATHLIKDRDMHSLLAEASKHGHLEVMRLLIDRKANLHAVGKDGLTPLEWAIREGQDEAAALLRLAGAER